MHANTKDLWAAGNSLLNFENIRKFLSNYINKEASLLLEGLTHGFKLQYTGPRQPLFSKKILSAGEHGDGWLDKEVWEGTIGGPFLVSPLNSLHFSPMGVVPKADGGWRMITHLSYPPNNSINSYIDPFHSKVKYTYFDTVIQTIGNSGQGTQLAKVDKKMPFVYFVFTLRI